ncbi:MAG: ATP-dependent DNA ligase [Nanoarchaeota archaeon]
MHYSEIVEVYERLGKTTKKLEKAAIIAEFLPRLRGHEEWVYLLRGRVVPDYDSRELGISTQLAIKAIARAAGVSSEEVVNKFKKVGDLGDVASELLKHRKQNSLFGKKLMIEHVFASLRKLAEITGDGAVDKKLNIISELLISASVDESRYIVRTLLGDLRVGVADAVLLDAIAKAFFNGTDVSDNIQNAYDLLNDFAEVLQLAFSGPSAFEKASLVPGRPLNPMLAVKVADLEEAFEVCGKPAAFEHKYDGFRVIISCDGKDIRLFTRRLEDVTKQFPDIVKAVRENVKAKKFILDSEAVGFDAKTGKYLPFEAVSQRIKRKYDIDELVKKLPIELNVFDVLFLDGEAILKQPFSRRREILEKILHEKPKVIRLAKQLVTDSVSEAEKFYKDALKIGEEGIMVKNLSMPYRPGRYVGYMVKLKPDVADLDLVIVGGEYGTGKRAGGLTSFIVACRSGDGFLEVGRVSSGLKEKSSEGTSYGEIDALLQPLIISEEGHVVRVKPKVIVSVTYQNIQASPTYSSGFALRFPRITHYRPERGLHDIASLQDIKREVAKMSRKLGKK